MRDRLSESGIPRTNSNRGLGGRGVTSD